MLLKILLGVVIVAEFVTVPVFLKYYWPDRCKQSFIFKVISAALFVLCGFLCVKITGNNTPYANLMMIGLFLGFIGDIFLHSLSDNKIHFAVGFLSFLAGHVMYIVAFHKAIKTTYPAAGVFSWYEIVLTLLCTLIVLAVLLKLKVFQGKELLMIPFFVYGLILFSMCFKALRYAIGEIAYGTNDNMLAVFLTVGLGGILFTISDLILGYTIPKGSTTRTLRIINIGTYFSAQILLALSILFVRSSYPLY